MKPLNKDEYWAKILSDLKETYGYDQNNSFDIITIDSFKVMFDMGWDLKTYTLTDELPANMHESSVEEPIAQETFVEIPSVFQKLYDKSTKH